MDAGSESGPQLIGNGLRPDRRDHLGVRDLDTLETAVGPGIDVLRDRTRENAASRFPRRRLPRVCPLLSA